MTTGTTQEPRLQGRLDETTAAFLADRARRAVPGNSSLSQRAREELHLWQAVLAAELGRVTLTRSEAATVAHVLGSADLHDGTGWPGYCYTKCADAFAIARQSPGGEISSFGAHHETDEAALLGKLAALGPAADAALADALSRWWDLGGQDDTVPGFARAGIRVTEA